MRYEVVKGFIAMIISVAIIIVKVIYIGTVVFYYFKLLLPSAFCPILTVKLSALSWFCLHVINSLLLLSEMFWVLKTLILK